MPLSGTIIKAESGLQGFDVNAPITSAQASHFKVNGLSFCVRYVPRTANLVAGNLTQSEAQGILSSGLALMAVQHCALPGWTPTPELGISYGTYAAEYAKSIAGLPVEINLWCDLEMVSVQATANQVSQYCRNWYKCVADAGFIPGLYVGYQTGLTNDELYQLPFQHYWAAYNTDNVPNPRGYQMVQKNQKTLMGITYDPNTTMYDNKGGSPIWIAPK